MALDFVINFNGNCGEAVKFYSEAFGIETTQIVKYRDLPQNPNFTISQDELDYVIIATMNIDGTNIMFQDLLKFMQQEFNSNVTISVKRSTVDEVTKLFNKLSEDGTVTCQLQKMEWSEWYGALKDKFGTSWQICI